MTTGKRIEVNEADLREFIEAAEEVRDEATCAVSDVQLGETTNVLYDQTENRFALALDALKFDLAEVSRG
jgi:hypothetical protein